MFIGFLFLFLFQKTKSFLGEKKNKSFTIDNLRDIYTIYFYHL